MNYKYTYKKVFYPGFLFSNQNPGSVSDCLYIGMCFLRLLGVKFVPACSSLWRRGCRPPWYRNEVFPELLWKTVLSLITFPCESKDTELGQIRCTDYETSDRHFKYFSSGLIRFVLTDTTFNQIIISCSVFISIICSITDTVKSKFIFQFSCNIR